MLMNMAITSTPSRRRDTGGAQWARALTGHEARVYQELCNELSNFSGSRDKICREVEGPG